MKLAGAAQGVRLYGVFHCVSALIMVWQMGRFMVAVLGVLTLVWAFELAARLSAGAKWAWWVALGAGLLFIARYGLGLRLQAILLIGNSSIPLHFSPVRSTIYTIGLGLSALTVIQLLRSRPRVSLQDPKSTAHEN